jgi:nucleotide sugar dehydrogenase
MVTDPASAETIKYASNAFLATKLSFINAVAAVCEAVGADVNDVVLGMGYDRRIGQDFLRPGPGFGGSCFPKDTRALIRMAEDGGYDFSLLRGALEVNDEQFDRVADKVENLAGGLDGVQIAAWGLTFKAGTDDLRESPMVILAEALLGKGYALKIYDRNVSLARLVGANKQYIDEQIPHLSRHLSESIDQVIDESEVVVIGNGSAEFPAAVERCRADQVVIDLVRLPLDFSRVQAQYDGICW